MLLLDTPPLTDADDPGRPDTGTDDDAWAYAHDTAWAAWAADADPPRPPSKEGAAPTATAPRTPPPPGAGALAAVTPPVGCDRPGPLGPVHLLPPRKDPPVSLLAVVDDPAVCTALAEVLHAAIRSANETRARLAALPVLGDRVEEYLRAVTVHARLCATADLLGLPPADSGPDHPRDQR